MTSYLGMQSLKIHCPIRKPETFFLIIDLGLFLTYINTSYIYPANLLALWQRISHELMKIVHKFAK